MKALTQQVVARSQLVKTGQIHALSQLTAVVCMAEQKHETR